MEKEGRGRVSEMEEEGRARKGGGVEGRGREGVR